MADIYKFIQCGTFQVHRLVCGNSVLMPGFRYFICRIYFYAVTRITACVKIQISYNFNLFNISGASCFSEELSR